MSEHVCGCDCIDPTLRPSTVRLSEGHVSVVMDAAEVYRVWLNGELQTHAFEAKAGRGDGWVLRTQHPWQSHMVHPYRGGCFLGGWCLERVYGDVAIARSEVPA